MTTAQQRREDREDGGSGVGESEDAQAAAEAQGGGGGGGEGGLEGGGGGGGGEGQEGGAENELSPSSSSSSPSSLPPRRLDASDGDEEDEESGMSGTVLHASLHIPHLFAPRKAHAFRLWRNFSAVAWCNKSGLLACATEVCAKDPRSESNLSFWIPIHIIKPERPTEHALFNVMAESPCDYIQFLEWSPPMCERALLVGSSSGRVSIWKQPTQGGPNVARAMNCWSCESEWQQDPAVCMKWIFGMSPYQWSSTATNVMDKQSIEEKFLPHRFRSRVRCPNILCVCSISVSGCIILHWCQWPSVAGTQQQWFSTRKGVLGAGQSELISADAIVNDSGTLLIAGAPMDNPCTVVVWEVCPLLANNQDSIQQTKIGIAPLPSVLLGWQASSKKDTKMGLDTSNHLSSVEPRVQILPVDIKSQHPLMADDADSPTLLCSPISNLSANVEVETKENGNRLGSGVVSIAFDPSKAGSGLVVLLYEGYSLSTDMQPLISYRVARWESSRQEVSLHPLFEPTATATYSGSSPPTINTIWRSKVDKTILVSKRGEVPRNNNEPPGVDIDQPVANNLSSKLVFSNHGAELAVVTAHGEVHTLSGVNLDPIDSYYLKVGIFTAVPAFSPSGCCLGTVWHDTKNDCSVLKIIRIFPPATAVSQGSNNNSMWERGLADRFWWSLLSEVDWWDAVGCTQSAVEDNLVTFHKVIAVLDADFHLLPSLPHRQRYGPSLDQIKCRMLEGVDGSDVRAVVLDMQARLLLEMLGKGIEAALINPGTFLADPWMASPEVVSGLAEVITVDPALLPYVQPYVDAILDLASHFLTRLRRYASFCRTLATHAAGTAASAQRISTSTSTGSAQTPSQSQLNSQTTTGNSNGTNPVQAWVQGAIAKVNSSTEGTASTAHSTASGPVTPLPLSVSQTTFPGMPAVRLVGDCNFLRRLCQLLLFCFLFRKRPLPRSAQTATTRSSDDNLDEVGPGRAGRIGNGNAGQGYTTEEVKFLFLVSVTLCKKTSLLAHPMPKSQIGSTSPSIRLHYPDGQFIVPPEVVEASLGHHVQNLPRPRGADSAGLLMKELELHPPAEDLSKRYHFGGPWAGALELYSQIDERTNGNFATSRSPVGSYLPEEMSMMRNLWPRKRRFAERDTAFGLNTAAEMGSFLGFMGSRRDTILAAWKSSAHGTWHKCVRCGRQTGALATPNANTSVNSSPNSVEAWWTGRWAYGCPICGGSWIRIV